jgi:dipeptidyl aminopeptidase/acylaminoacyl peptidase
MVTAYDRVDDYEEVASSPVYKFEIEPHWLAGNDRFWYRNGLPGGRQEFVLIDAVAGSRKPAFDHAKLAAGLSSTAGRQYDPQRLPFDSIAYVDDGAAIDFVADGVPWRCELASYVVIRRAEIASKAPDTDPQTPPKSGDDAPADPNAESASPDGKLVAFIRDNNLYVRSANGSGEAALSNAGTSERPFGGIAWSPDSRTIVAYRIKNVEAAPVYMVESSPASGGTRGVLHQHAYEQPGDEVSSYEMYLFDPQAKSGRPASIDIIDFGDIPDLQWRKDSKRFLFERTDRGHQRFRVVEVDVASGNCRNVVDERADTFINTSNAYSYYTAGAAQLIYVSEQDGWRHLYLVDIDSGARKQITRGEWVVRSVDRVDEDARRIWFQASGVNKGEDPYLIHHYRADFDGSNLVALTEGNGTHTVQYSPDRRYLIDTYSRADFPPVHTLRRTSDGSYVCDLETCDVDALIKNGWLMPEVFSAPGRDGVTEIWGIVFRPTNLDPRKKYPIIENIYAGPQDSFVRKSFSVRDDMQSLAELGFIVVQCDGMGTRNRSKAFHDVCWHNLKDAGFPDRIAWIKALAAKYPYCDTDRVGIYGTSAGGQNSTGAVLFHPEFYKVAVSSCGCHDNRIDKRWWNEQWMGYPVGPWYADSSNITHASNLRGRLFLMVGELDTNVPPESTLRLADALMKAGKDFDLLVLPGFDHTGGGPYGDRRRRDYFVRHLLGAEPPDRNAPKPVVQPIVLKPRNVAEASSAEAAGGADTTIEFRNRTSTELSLFWLSGNGARTPYGSIKPGESHLQHTYSGHYWLLVDPEGKPVALYVGNRKPGIAEVGQ